MGAASTTGSFEIDFTKFNQAFLEYALKTAPAAAEKGLFEALSQLKIYADEVTPKTPHLEGNLRGDYTFILEGITQSIVAEKSGGKGKDHHKGGEKPAERIGAKDIIAKIIFRQPYAARWHETEKTITWSELGVGRKYLESKLNMYKDALFRIVARRIKETTEK